MSDAPAAPVVPPTLAARVRIHVADAVDGPARDGIDTVDVPADSWFAAAQALRDHEGFVRFIDLTVVDDPEAELRFEVHLLTYSMKEHRWGRLRTRTSGALASVFSLYAGAHNYEREAFDMFGVTFAGHPQLTRILMPDGWKGHPLRRDEDLVVERVDFTVTRDLYKT
ncbi:MAG TPA: NADH-quinone oxidoreductase subunit C [Myxococcota bacterium]